MDWNLIYSIRKEEDKWLVLDHSGNVLATFENNIDACIYAKEWCDDPERKSNSAAVMD